MQHESGRLRDVIIPQASCAVVLSLGGQSLKVVVSFFGRRGLVFELSHP